MTFEPESDGNLAHRAMLFEVAREEALQYARALRRHFEVFRTTHAVPPPFVYAAHALAESSRFMDIQPAAELASALEGWLRAHKDAVFESEAGQAELLEQAVAALEGMAQSIAERRMPVEQPALVRQLLPPAHARRAGDGQAVAQVRDDGDMQLLPLFLDEADGLGRKIGKELHAWHGAPEAESHPRTLKRLLHTLKGSARMAGAMRIGEVIHAMEDHVASAEQGRAQPSFRDALDADFGRIGELLEELRAIGAVAPGRRAEDRGERGAAGCAPESGVEPGAPGNVSRMVSFSIVAERLYRILRRTAKELNKRANLELPGAGVEVERGMLERMTAPLEHLLRNAIAHGLESEPERIRGGKPPIGEIRLALRRTGGELVFEFSDDGAGLDFDALREKALERGLLKPDEAAAEERLAQLIFVSGFSTVDEVGKVAGRGIGLDVVRSEVEALRGRIEVDSRRGLGTRFTIHVPAAPAFRA